MNACPVRRVLPRWYCKRHRFVSVRDAAGCRTTVTKRVRKLRQARQIYSVRHGSIDQDSAMDRSRGSAVVFRLVLRRLRDGRRLPHRLREQRSRRLPYGTDARSKSVPVIRGLATTTLRQRRSFQTPSCATPGVHLPPGVPRLWLNRKPVRYAAAGGPNQVVSASARPRCWPSPTHAACPSGRINTAVGAVTAPSAGSSHTPSYLASTD